VAAIGSGQQVAAAADGMVERHPPDTDEMVYV
jgi:hypothetical protein